MSQAGQVQADGPIAIPITLHFGGEIPLQGLDADEVAAVAEGMAKAVQFLSSRAVDGERQYNLHLREVRPGSAIFQFLLEGAGIVQAILPVLPPGGFSMKQVGEVFAYAVKLLDFLNKKPPAATSSVNGDNNVVVTNSEGAQVTVNHYIVQVAGNAYFQEQAERVVKPLKKPGRSLAIKQEDERLLTATSENYAAITARPMNDNQPITANTIEATLRVRQPHLDGEDSWKFAWGRNRITAQVRDKDFMDKVRAGAEEFRSGDVLRVRMRIEEQQKGKNVTKHHYIEEVLTKDRGA
jgi:hypothetical protein